MSMLLQHRRLDELRPGELVEVDGEAMLVAAVGQNWASFTSPTWRQRFKFWLRRHICIRGFWSRV